MTPEYTFEINKKDYLLKRLFHVDLPLTYHVHFFYQYRDIILRMGLIHGKWKFLDNMHIHFKFEDLQFKLATEIGDNENRIVTDKKNALAHFGL